MNKKHTLGIIKITKKEIHGVEIPEKIRIEKKYILEYNEQNKNYTLRDEFEREYTHDIEYIYRNILEKAENLEYKRKELENPTIKISYKPLENNSSKTDKYFIDLINTNRYLPSKQDIFTIKLDDGRSITFKESIIESAISFEEKTKTESIQSKTYTVPKNLQIDFYKTLKESKITEISLPDHSSIPCIPQNNYIKTECPITILRDILSLICDIKHLTEENIKKQGKKSEKHQILLESDKNKIIAKILKETHEQFNGGFFKELDITFLTALSEALPENTTTIFHQKSKEYKNQTNTIIIKKEKSHQNNNTQTLIEIFIGESNETLTHQKGSKIKVIISENPKDGEKEYSLESSGIEEIKLKKYENTKYLKTELLIKDFINVENHYSTEKNFEENTEKYYSTSFKKT